jgi:hypothetical protein
MVGSTSSKNIFIYRINKSYFYVNWVVKRPELFMQNKKHLIVLLFFLAITNVFSQLTENEVKPKYNRACAAYGFLLGQEHSLEFIKLEFPQYDLNVLKAQLQFDASFGKSIESLEEYLINYFGPNGFQTYKDTLLGQVKELFKSQNFTEGQALNFLIEVENRAKGNMESPILETLLSFRFSESPVEEFLSGFTTTFKTKGHPKSKNTDWQIKVPKSWKAEEADRPNIIQKFTSDYGSGKQSIMLMVHDMELPEDYIISKEEINALFTEEEIKKMTPEDGKFISFVKMVLDNNIGGMIEFEMTKYRLDLEIKMRMVQFMFIRGNKMYFLQGTVTAENSTTDLTLEMKKYLPLYRQVANTIVVNDQY